MKIQVLDRAKKKKFISELAEFGLGKISETLVRTGKERIRAFSGDLDRGEIMEIWRMFPIEGVGLYVGKEFMNRSGVREVRLSVDGMHAWKSQLNERIFVLSEEQEEKWFLGQDIELKDCNIDGGFVLVKSADGKDFVGMGKIGSIRYESNGVKSQTLFGYLPKERRRKSSMI